MAPPHISEACVDTENLVLPVTAERKHAVVFVSRMIVVVCRSERPRCAEFEAVYTGSNVSHAVIGARIVAPNVSDRSDVAVGGFHRIDPGHNQTVGGNGGADTTHAAHAQFAVIFIGNSENGTASEECCTGFIACRLVVGTVVGVETDFQISLYFPFTC